MPNIWVKKRIIAETGAGQHGTSTAAMAGANLGFETVVYMGAKDVERQRMKCTVWNLWYKGVSCEVGSMTLKDAINETQGDWVTNVENTHYLIGSVVGATSLSDDREGFPEV